ncbi:MAG TPA: ATP-binding protein [Candidatus Dormibacteraeota bacterium]|jgi:signal transduction histidine kinase/transcriptional regulator with GAF, ATPase, and Fis domain
MPGPARRGLKVHTRPKPARVPAAPVAAARLKAARRLQEPVLATTPAELIHELSSCITEADIVQVLYRGLEPLFGYGVVLLQVLDREGWYHSLAIDTGVLQDLRRRPLAGSFFADHYKNPRTTVKTLDPKWREQGKGPGASRTTKLSIWVPVEHRGEVIASLIYQSYRNRRVPASETAFLEEVHRRLGVLIANAALNELTRNQARRLEALNSIARAMASTLDEASVLTALHSTLNELLPVDTLEMVSLPDGDAQEARLMRVQADSVPISRQVPMRSPQLVPARALARDPKPLLTHEPSSSLWVAIKEGGVVRGALGIKSKRSYLYEESTASFLELVSDEVTLALRNARSYEAIENQRRRLEVVNSIGRRLASSLDRWSIMRTLREELASFLSFDGFILATITQTADGPIASGYQYVAGVEEVAPPVALAVTGASREAYETGKPVLMRTNPWAHTFKRSSLERERWNIGEGAAIFPSGPPGDRRLISRSFVWVPVLSGDQITALLSLQSYREGAFDEWHVKLLQDVAAHVSLALANAGHYAEAQAERARLEALHILEMGVAGASDEKQIAEAIFSVASEYLEATHMVLAYLDAAGDVAAFTVERGGPVTAIGPVPISEAPFFRRMIEEETAVLEVEPADPGDLVEPIGSHIFTQSPSHVVWVPITQTERVVAGIAAMRNDGGRFQPTHLRLLETAAPVVGIALRTMRLHHANELALAQSVRIQELAALAGHELMSVVANIADQARTMLECAGAVCWAFDTEGRISATRGSGDLAAEQVLSWAGLSTADSWRDAHPGVMSGTAHGHAWGLIPLWYGDRLVGAIGSVHASTHLAEPTSAVLDFSRHAAVAIENSRLVAETRGRIRTLEAVAAFAELTPTEPDRARSEMARLISRALAGSQGELWLLEDGQLVRRSDDGEDAPRVPVSDSAQLLRALGSPAGSRRLRALLDLLGAPPDAFAIPIQVEGGLAGLLVARMTAGGAETRRLAAVLAGQAAVQIGQLELVDALDRERRMMNAILRHSPVGVMLEDAAGRIVYANPEIESIYNLRAAEMPGQKPADIYSAAGAVPSEEGAADGTLELRMRDPDRTVHVRRVVIPGLEGEPAGLLTLHEDVTAQRLALEAKDLMLRAIGHEVRSPAAAMKNTLAGIMQWDNTIGPTDRRELLQEAYESSDRLLSLVESQLIIAKLETRHFEPNPEIVDLGPALDGVMGVLMHRYQERSAAVKISLPAGLRAYCEPTHLAQVLTNLVANALEYTTGPVLIEARQGQRGWLEITVADNGSGLPAASLETVFEKTGPAGRSRSQGGLGLGLYLCRLVVERSFGGRIWVATSDRNGTTFKFTVPAGNRP